MTFNWKISAVVFAAITATALPAAAAPYRGDRDGSMYRERNTMTRPHTAADVAAGFIGGATFGLLAPQGWHNRTNEVPYAYRGGTLHDQGPDRLHNGVANF